MFLKAGFQSILSEYDLDNIKLNTLGSASTLYAEFELEHVLLTGSCSDLSSGGFPPQGLELNLGTEKTPHLVDTLVMQNLGYFQLKANPGVWVLTLAEGKARHIYSMADGKDSLRVVISEYSGKFLQLDVRKRPGKEHLKLLLDEKEEEKASQAPSTKDSAPSNDDGMWGYVEGLFGDKKNEAKETKKKEKTIHIFSLASGHLYERFLKIMMLSVVNHTSSPVKFWFLKNYLSPQFKNFVPHMAEKHGFEVELVTYKWPAWLHRQTEKQRIIWGMKILFLDVLFPLDVDRIIYVDADQVLRADIKELRDLDLKGAPLGYTAFCDSRKEMEGFRFWKQGYWMNHLRGKPYHISALYVVDLKKFRLMAAGDRMRSNYDGLSKDPNSLSNLDQDLPNYLQHMIRIHTLPQEWLWCETWCDDQSKKKAKSIDLCNNPLTKTPKLENALRIIEEWTQYDEQAKAVEKQYRDV
eukprot:TRINITY_DN3503_c0_g1_i2.p1 TRINITY_DN3503_c0_g1~~TRINITY_DN3503_c0_g1_i2.p1  ORF type:complete len:467 (+),score=152.66 TRINITY_DN3503_c0_g1_i2:79-1479(+)